MGGPQKTTHGMDVSCSAETLSTQRSAGYCVMRPTQRLPNGLEVFYLTQENASFLYRELFVDQVYQRNGMEAAEGDVIFDVGANIGMYLIHLNQLLTKATVFCFEPIPDVFETLKLNAAKHNHLDVKLMNCGLSHAPGTAAFTYYPRSAMRSTMYPEMSDRERRDFDNAVLETLRGKGDVHLPWLLRGLLAITAPPLKRLIAGMVRRFLSRSRQVQCILRTISDVIDEYGAKRIDLLKIDTESSELDILRGVRAEHWPLVRRIVMEVHRGEEQLRQIRTFLEERGFQVDVRQDSPTFTTIYTLYANCRVSQLASSAV